jgi:hypothetical protein
MKSCHNRATWELIDGPRPDDYTLSCDLHVEDLKSDTHVAAYPFHHDNPAVECCYIYPDAGEGAR